jgi:hypothetical protein
MSSLKAGGIVLGSVLGLAAAGAAPAASPAGPAAGRAGLPGGEEEVVDLAGALERALADGWHELHILTQCQDGRSLPTAEIFGTGTAIWNGEAQFRLPRGVISAQLTTISESGFVGWPSSFGGKRDPAPTTSQPPRVTCRVRLDLDGHRKQVVQFHYGDQSPELVALARRILDSCRGPAQSGVRARSLDDGLAKVATGELDPVTLRVIVNRRGSLSPREEAGEAWLLRIEHGEVTTRGHSRERGYGEPAVLPLDREALADLMTALREVHLADLPPNLYAEQYTDVTVSVLDHRAQIQARRFEGMTPATHGEKQKSFDRLLKVIETLRARALQRQSGEDS